MRDQATQEMQRIGRTFRQIGDEAGTSAGYARNFASELNKSVSVAITAYTHYRALLGVMREFSTFEKAIIGVAKTTGLAGEELEKFKESILKMGHRTPVPLEDLTQTAIVAGQLGISAREDIEKFTETMAKMGVATDLQGEVGAKQMARMLNVTKESIGMVNNFGSALVQLGNNAAASESEIMGMASEIAQATTQFRIASHEAAALGTLAAELGLRQQVVGTTIGRVYAALDKAIARGGQSLKTIAQLTNMTEAQFSQLFRSNPTKGFLAFAQALGKVQEKAKTSNQAAKFMYDFLEGMNLGMQEVSKTLKPLLGNYERMEYLLNMSKEAYESNTALNKEAAIAFSSLSSAMDQTRNAIKTAAIALGTEFAPVAKIALQAVSNLSIGLSQFIAGMDPFTRKVVVGMISFATAIGTVALAFRVLQPLLVMIQAGLISINIALMGTPIGWLIKGLLLLVAAWEAVRRITFQYEDTIVSVGDVVYAYFGAIYETIRYWYHQLKKWLADVKKGWEDFKASLPGGGGKEAEGSSLSVLGFSGKTLDESVQAYKKAKKAIEKEGPPVFNQDIGFFKVLESKMLIRARERALREAEAKKASEIVVPKVNLEDTNIPDIVDPETAKKAAKEAERFANKLEDVLLNLKKEAVTLSMNSRERKIYEEAVKLDIDALNKENLTKTQKLALSKIELAVNDVIAAQARRRVVELNIETESLRKMANVYTMSNRQKQVQIALIQAEEKAKKEGYKLEDSERKAIAAKVEAQLDAQEAERRATAIRDLEVEIEKQKALAGMLNMTAAARAAEEAVITAVLDAKKQDITLTQEEIDKIRELARVKFEASQAQRSFAVAMQEYWDEYSRTTVDINEAMMDSIKTMVSSLEDSMMNFFMGQEDAWRQLVNTIIQEMLRLLVIKPLINSLFMPLLSSFGASMIGWNSALSGLFMAQGGVVGFAQGGAFSNQILNSPTLFKFGTGGSKLGIAGEAGPEGILPLKRMPSGNLGVEASGGMIGSISINVGVTMNSSNATTEEDGKQIGTAVAAIVDERIQKYIQKNSRAGGVFKPVFGGREA
jgi:TP901 family phage tail tape measure protein/lambda family phage tail tape measure protein